ncbi:MAG: helix-turn-helix transcriptional regulator [Nanoarchaeota archaeon]
MKKEKKDSKTTMNIVEWFKMSGVKQNFFSEKSGIPSPTLVHILKKRRVPSIEMALQIEKATDGLVTLYNWSEWLKEHDGDEKTKKE